MRWSTTCLCEVRGALRISRQPLYVRAAILPAQGRHATHAIRSQTSCTCPDYSAMARGSCERPSTCGGRARIRLLWTRCANFCPVDHGCSAALGRQTSIGSLLPGWTPRLHVPAGFRESAHDLIDAPDDAYGQAWHVPNAPTRSLRELLTLGAALAVVRPGVTVLPKIMMSLPGLVRTDVRELKEMRFQWDRPYRVVDATKFLGCFWSDAKPFEDGLRTTIAFYRTSARNATDA
jgi:hypothetical protein